jgi:hypothetical protein
MATFVSSESVTVWRRHVPRAESQRSSRWASCAGRRSCQRAPVVLLSHHRSTPRLIDIDPGPERPQTMMMGATIPYERGTRVPGDLTGTSPLSEATGWFLRHGISLGEARRVGGGWSPGLCSDFFAKTLSRNALAADV